MRPLVLDYRPTFIPDVGVKSTLTVPAVTLTD